MKRMTSLLLFTSLAVGCGQKSNSQTADQAKPEASVATAASSASPSDSAAASASSEVAQPGKQKVTYEQLIKAAEQLVEKKDRQNALRVLTAAINGQPTRSEAYVKRAALLVDAQLHQQAISDMSSAIGIDSDNSRLRNTRGYFYLLIKDYAAAEKDFNKAIDLQQDYPQAYNNRGLVFIGQNQYIKALNDFQTAIKLKPDYVDALNNLGFVFLQMEDPDYEKAIANFTKVLELDESYMNALSNRGRAHLKIGQQDAAIADFSRAIELQPGNDQYYLHRSEAYRAAGQEELAKADLSHVVWSQRLAEINRRIKNNPKNVDLWILRGRHLLEEEQISSAEKSFNNALALEPKNMVALTERVKLHVAQSQIDEAVALCTKSLEAHDSTEVRSLRGDAYLKLGKFDEAITDYEAARRFDSRVVQAYRQRAEARTSAGETEMAQADKERAEILEKRLTDQASGEESAKPRAFVPVSFEQTAAEQEKTVE